MKVDETYQSANLIEQAKEGGTGTRAEQTGPHAGETETSVRPRGTEVDLSTAGREVMKAREAMETHDPARAERVAELKQQVAEGTYEADPQDVAARILDAGLSELL